MMNDDQLQTILAGLSDLKERSPFYREKYKDLDLSAVRSEEDFHKLPMTDKHELRDAYPLGLQAVPEKEVVRIHSSSGTTGTPVIIPYTKKDVDDWSKMFERCYLMAGVTEMDRIHITPGYGLWTAGIGFQAGAERVGAMAIPMGPGNTDKQIKMMQDLRSTVLCATSSYALLLAEEIEKRGVKESIHLERALIGSERWGEKMRKRIASELGVRLYDIYGLTEIYGPGVGISCDCDCGIHYWSDYIYIEIIDPKTGKNVPDGEIGEIVITTLQKQGAPLIRYRTHDLSRIIPGKCECGSEFPRIATLIGRTDDMVKVKGVNIFPGQIDEIISEAEGASSEYQVIIDHLNGRDIMTVLFETKLSAEEGDALESRVCDMFKSRVGLTIVAKAVPMGDLPRSEKKSNRIFDNRY